MKIAFMGTHGVGKTTLCFELAAALKRRDLSVDLAGEPRECWTERVLTTLDGRT